MVRCLSCFSVYENSYKSCPHCGYTPGEKAAEKIYLNPGTVLWGRYNIGQVIGSGGFGIIYKAWDNAANMTVAVKEYFQSGLVSRAPETQHIYLVAQNREEEFLEGKRRFIEESLRLREFTGHPNMVAMLDTFEENNTVYHVMEFLTGDTLDAYIEKGLLTLHDKLDITQKVGIALSVLHNSNILHRDISPDNIMLTQNYPAGDVKLFDFGAARFSPDEKDILQTRVMKPGYSPPEQYGPGSGQNEQTDVYALGATLYYMLTGIKPEEATNRRIEDTLPPPKSLNSEIPDNVSNAVLTAMALDLHLRYKTVEEFLSALDRADNVRTPAELMQKRKKKRKLIIISSAACILLGFAVVGALMALEIGRTTLPDSTINLLYSISGDEAANSAKERALSLIIEDFESIYPNVSVALRGIPEELYADEVDALLRSGYPAVFESGMLDTASLARALDLGGILGDTEREELYFLDNYSRHFPDGKQMPLGFNVSAFYINRQLSEFDGEGVSEINALFASMPFAVAELGLSYNDLFIEDFYALFGGGFRLTERESFINNETGAYFSNTSEYYALLSEMPGRFNILYVDNARVPAEFSGLWSIMPGTSAEQRTARRFLQFMLSENAQHFMHIGSRSGALPLSKQALSSYCEIYVDFSEFFTNTANYAFNYR